MILAQGPVNSAGLMSHHWYDSSSSFTIIINFVMLKLFIESVFWNWLSFLAAIISLLLYYGFVILLST